MSDRYTKIARLERDKDWAYVVNMTWADVERCLPLLINEFNDYVEWRNCGVIHRMIRTKDLTEYGMDEGECMTTITVEE